MDIDHEPGRTPEQQPEIKGTVLKWLEEARKEYREQQQKKPENRFAWKSKAETPEPSLSAAPTENISTTQPENDEQLYINEAKYLYPAYAMDLAKKHNTNPELRKEREKFWQNYHTFEDVFKILVEHNKKSESAEKITALQLVDRAVSTLVPQEKRPAELTQHLSEVKEYSGRLFTALRKAAEKKNPQNQILTPRQQELMTEVIAPMHDMLKFLSDQKGQITPDHEILIGNLVKTHFANAGFSPEDVEFLALIGNHENIYKEEDRDKFAISEKPVEVGESLFFVLDTLTNVVDTTALENGELKANSEALKERFTDLYFRHIDLEKGKVFRPEWGTFAIRDLTATFRHLITEYQLTADPIFFEMLNASAQAAIDAAFAENEKRKVAGNPNVFSDEQLKRITAAETQLDSLRSIESRQHGNFHVIEGVTQNANAQKIVDALDIKDRYDRCIFVMGGASGLDETKMSKLRGLLTDTIAQVARESQGKLLVGDGGTNSGIMEMDGHAREAAMAANSDMVLIGVPPKENVRYPGWNEGDTKGVYDAEPRHNYIIPVESKPRQIGEYGAWGNETNMMYQIFNLLAQGKDSMGLVVNGGGITLNEVIKNLEADRELIVMKGTGRAADGIAAFLSGTDSSLAPESEEKKLLDKFKTKCGDKLEQWKSLMTVFDLDAGNTENFSELLHRKLKMPPAR